eukprot:131484-Amphidinium_carterae.1
MKLAKGRGQGTYYIAPDVEGCWDRYLAASIAAGVHTDEILFFPRPKALSNHILRNTRVVYQRSVDGIETHPRSPTAAQMERNFTLMNAAWSTVKSKLSALGYMHVQQEDYYSPLARFCVANLLSNITMHPLSDGVLELQSLFERYPDKHWSRDPGDLNLVL